MVAKIQLGDCLNQMRILDKASIDSIVTDPPYGLSFMGKGWDHGVPGVEVWAEALRVAKPGAHLLAFGGTRTYHRLACAIEDAGWEIRDCVMWVYGTGCPKSHDVSKAIDNAAGAEREKEWKRYTANNMAGSYVQSPWLDKVRKNGGRMIATSNPATDAGRQWSGWGTALKPAWEPIIVARKPLCGTVVENVLAHGTGGINVDGCRVAWRSEADMRSTARADLGFSLSRANGTAKRSLNIGKESRPGEITYHADQLTGRWPANLIHDGSDEVTGLFPTTTSGGYHGATGQDDVAGNRGDSGSAARFFYCAKASRADREEGCNGLDAHKQDETRNEGDPGDNPRNRGANKRSNHHPTVKPTDLMRYLCRLVTPPGGTVLDPFMGSGSTGKAAILEGFQFFGIEREAEYVEIAKARVAKAIKKGQSIGIVSQCVSGLPIGNGDSSNIVSSLGGSCDARPECGTRSNFYNNKLDKAICTTSYLQRDLFEGLE